MANPHKGKKLSWKREEGNVGTLKTINMIARDPDGNIIGKVGCYDDPKPGIIPKPTHIWGATVFTKWTELWTNVISDGELTTSTKAQAVVQKIWEIDPLEEGVWYAEADGGRVILTTRDDGVKFASHDHEQLGKFMHAVGVWGNGIYHSSSMDFAHENGFKEADDAHKLLAKACQLCSDLNAEEQAMRDISVFRKKGASA